MSVTIKTKKLNGSAVLAVKTPLNGKKTKIKREIVCTQENVAIKVAKKHDYFMRYFKSFIGDNGEKIGPYWRNGKPMGKKIYLNCFFYGLDDFADLGRTITARVDIIKKTIYGPGGKREFIMLNITKTPERWSLYKISFQNASGAGTEIIGTNKEIVFVRIKTPSN